MPFKARVACFSKINAGIQDLLDLSRLPWLTRLLLTDRARFSLVLMRNQASQKKPGIPG